jgi:hypothetical protein
MQEQASTAMLQQQLGQVAEQARAQEQANRFAAAARGQLGGSQEAMARGQIAGQQAFGTAQAQLVDAMRRQQMQDQAAMQQAAHAQQAFSNPFADASVQALIRGLQGEQQGLQALQGVQQQQAMAQRHADALAGQNIGGMLTGMGDVAQMHANVYGGG